MATFSHMNTPDKDGTQPDSDKGNSVLLRVIIPVGVGVGGALVAVVVVVVVATLLVAVYKKKRE